MAARYQRKLKNFFIKKDFQGRISLAVFLAVVGGCFIFFVLLAFFSRDTLTFSYSDSVVQVGKTPWMLIKNALVANWLFLLVGGTLQCALEDRPEVRAAMRYLATGLSTHGWLAMSGEGATYAGLSSNPRPNGFVSPHKDTPLERYRTPAERFCGEIIRGADTLRLSQTRIPDEVMSIFGSQMVAYVNRYDTRVDDAATVLKKVEEARTR